MTDFPEGRTRPGIRRRDFLALVPAAVAAASWPRAAFAGNSPLELDLWQGRPLSVGYLAGSREWADRDAMPWDSVEAPGPERPDFDIEVVPAEELSVSSELADRTIELAVHGLVPGLPPSPSWKSAFFFASLPAPVEMPFGPNPVPFLAWSARADGDVRQAAKVRSRLTTGIDGSLHVALEVGTGQPSSGSPRLPREQGLAPAKPSGSSRLLSTNFTVDSIPGRPRLQPGVYLLAFEPGLWRRPWSGPISDLSLVPGLESVAIAVRTPD